MPFNLMLMCALLFLITVYVALGIIEFAALPSDKTFRWDRTYDMVRYVLRVIKP